MAELAALLSSCWCSADQMKAERGKIAMTVRNSQGRRKQSKVLDDSLGFHCSLLSVASGYYSFICSVWGVGGHGLQDTQANCSVWMLDCNSFSTVSLCISLPGRILSLTSLCPKKIPTAAEPVLTFAPSISVIPNSLHSCPCHISLIYQKKENISRLDEWFCLPLTLLQTSAFNLSGKWHPSQSSHSSLWLQLLCMLSCTVGGWDPTPALPPGKLVP